MRNDRTEKHFNLDKTSKKTSKITFRYLVSFLSNHNFQYFLIAEFLESFIKPFSCYVFDKKSQQVFHITLVINVIIILVDAHKNYRSVHRVAIIVSRLGKISLLSDRN